MNKLLVTIPTTWFDPKSFSDRAQWFIEQFNTVIDWSSGMRLNKKYNSPDIEPEMLDSTEEINPVFVGTDESLNHNITMKVYFPEDRKYLEQIIPNVDDVNVLLNVEKIPIGNTFMVKVSIVDILSNFRSIKNLVNIYGIGLKRQVCISLATHQVFLKSCFNRTTNFKYVAQVDYNCGHIYRHLNSDGKYVSPITGTYNKITYKLSTMYEALEHILENINGAVVVGINKRQKGKALGSADRLNYKTESMSLHKFYIFNLDLLNQYHSPLHDTMAEDITLWARLNISGKKTYRLGSYGQDDIRDYNIKSLDRSSRFNIAYVCPQNDSSVFVPYVEYYSGSYNEDREYGCDHPDQTSGIYINKKYYVQPKPIETTFNVLNYIPIFLTNNLFRNIDFTLNEAQLKRYMKDTMIDQILYRDITGNISEFKTIPGFDHTNLYYSDQVIQNFFDGELYSREMVVIANHDAVMPIETNWGIKPPGQIHSTTINFDTRYLNETPIRVKSSRANIDYVYVLDLLPNNLLGQLSGNKKYDLRWDIIMLCMSLFMMICIRMANSIKFGNEYVTIKEITYLGRLLPKEVNVFNIINTLIMWASRWMTQVTNSKYQLKESTSNSMIESSADEDSMIESVEDSYESDEDSMDQSPVGEDSYESSFVEEDSYSENDEDSYME